MNSHNLNTIVLYYSVLPAATAARAPLLWRSVTDEVIKKNKKRLNESIKHQNNDGSKLSPTQDRLIFKYQI